MTETSKDAQALVGSTIAGRYRLTGVLGRGSTGIVFEGWHEELERGIAVKVLDPEWAEPPEAVDRYLAEIGKISAIDHPHVVRIHDAGRLADGRPFVAMERLKGASFAQLVDMDEGLPPRRVAALLEGVADALDLLHRHGHLHLDLKPENIVLAKVGEGPAGVETAKILDFGMAALGTSRPGDSKEERARPIPEYLAPEIAAGREPTSRADVYSLAAVAFELLTGIPPFDWASSAAWRKPVGDPEWVPTLAGRSGVPYPAELEAVIARGLAREPEERHPTATAFVKDLAAATEKIPRPVGDEMSVSAFARASREVTAKVPKIELAEDAPRVSEPERDTAVDSQPPDMRASIADSVCASIAESVAGATESAAAAVRRSIPAQRGDTRPLAALSSIPPATEPTETKPEPAVPKPPRDPKIIPGTRASIDSAAPIPLVAVPTRKPTTDEPGAREEPASGPRPRSRGVAWRMALVALLLLTGAYALNHEQVGRWLRAAETSEASSSAERTRPEATAEPPPEPEPPPAETSPHPTPPAPAPMLVATDDRRADRDGRARDRAAMPATVTSTESTQESPASQPTAPVNEATPTAEPTAEPDRVPSVPPEESARAEMLTREGTNALVRGLLPRAIELFRDATLAAPRHAAAWRGLGLANERLGRRPEAVYAYERYLRLAPNAADSGNVRERLDRLGGTAQR